MYLYYVCACGAHGGQKDMSDIVALKSHCHVDVENGGSDPLQELLLSTEQCLDSYWLSLSSICFLSMPLVCHEESTLCHVITQGL